MGMKKPVTPFEYRALQACVAVLAFVPFYGGLRGVVAGVPGVRDTSFAMHGAYGPVDSHYVYLSGMLMAVAVWFWTCVPEIEKRSRRFEVLVSLVFAGGVVRALRILTGGVTDNAALFALACELIAAPLLLVWQRRAALDYKIKRRQAAKAAAEKF